MITYLLYKLICLLDYIDYKFIKKEKLLDNYKTTKDIDISKSSRLKGISENRNREKMLSRKVEYIELDRQSNPNEGKIVYINSEEDNDFAEDFRLLKKIQKERFDGE